MDSEFTGKKQGRFQPGVSGNAAGRPKGSRNKTTLAVESLLEGQAEALTQKAIERALDGDPAALRLCLDRLAPPRRDRPVEFSLPAVKEAADCRDALAAILAATAEGELTLSEAATLAKLVTDFADLDAKTEVARKMRDRPHVPRKPVL